MWTEIIRIKVQIIKKTKGIYKEERRIRQVKREEREKGSGEIKENTIMTKIYK